MSMPYVRQITEAKLSQIEPGIRAFIVVRIVRLWKTMLPPHNEFISLDFVAFDDQKNAMHGTIPSKYSDELEYQLIEGRVYKIKMFQVTKRKQSHNALPMEKMLYLNSTTEIEEINNDIDGYPHYYFQFATMEDIVHRTDHEYFMTDVIGLLTSVTPISIVQISPKQFNTNVVGQASTQNLNASKWDIFIKLLSGDILRISIWENFLHQLDVENLLQQTNKPVIVVAGTTVNPTWKEQSTIELVSTQGITTGQFDAQSMKIEDLHYLNPKQVKGQKYKVNAKIASINMRRGWYYKSCSMCTFRVDDGRDNFVCARHGLTTPKLIMRLNLTLQDETGKLEAVVFGSLAEKLSRYQLTSSVISTGVQNDRLPD